MPNDNNTPSSSDETLDETENPQGETPNNTTGNGETPPTEPATPPSLDELKAQLARLEAAQKRTNADATKHRMRNTELEKTNAELTKFKEQVEAEKLSEQEKQTLARQNLEKQLAESQAKHMEQERLTQERIFGYEVRLQAANMGVEPKHLDKMARLLDWSEIEYDDNGTPTNVKSLLDALHKDMPELFVKKAPPTSGGATNPPSSQTSKQALSWEVIGKLTPSQYEARRHEIQRWMADPKNQHKRF